MISSFPIPTDWIEISPLVTMRRKAIIGSILGILLLAAFVLGTSSHCDLHPYDLNVSTLETVLERYRIDYGKLPPSSENYVLVDILSGNNSMKISYIVFKESNLNKNREMIDSWGTPLRIIFNSEQSFSIRSAGPDRTFGTEDDAQFD